MLAEYKRSLKIPEAEELFDILFYRPAAFVFVKLVYKTPITPNQVTILSMIAGLIAGYDLSFGVRAAYTGAAIWYTIANILDCADGQLARLQQSGTPLGRIIDGLADYVASVAIFLGIGFGYANGRFLPWMFVVGAGLSSALHAMIFDHFQSEFIAAGKSQTQFKRDEIERYQSEIRALQNGKGGAVRILVLRLYVRYLTLQSGGKAKPIRTPDSETYRSTHRTMIRLFSYLGPTTNRTILIVCALAGKIQYFLWIVILPLNIWMIVTLLLQRRIANRLSPVPRTERS